MASNAPPAWSYFLGALLAIAFGLFLLIGYENTVFGVGLLVAGAVFIVIGIQTGRRSLASAGPPMEEAVASADGAPTPLDVRERSVGDYTNEAAVRGIEKPKRICSECNSPVLPKASECPTCGSAL